MFGCTGSSLLCKGCLSLRRTRATLGCGDPCSGFSCGRAGTLGKWALVVAAHGLNCLVAYGIFPDQGSNLYPLYWQADFYPLSLPGSPSAEVLSYFLWKLCAVCWMEGASGWVWGAPQGMQRAEE